MRALALHPDVLIVTSAVLQLNCVIVRGVGAAAADAPGAHGAEGEVAAGESFVIDSPVLPGELEALPALLEQARFPPVSGLLVTHADWDHLLGRLAFPELALGCAESTVARLAAEPGAAQRELRRFDEALMIERRGALALGSTQALPVPGLVQVGALELELHPTAGHTADGMAVWIPWARVLVAGDYLSPVEIPTLDQRGSLDAYRQTLERLGALLGEAEHVLPGHGPPLDRERAARVLEEDLAYLKQLREQRQAAELPPARRTRQQRGLHAQNLERLEG